VVVIGAGAAALSGYPAVVIDASVWVSWLMPQDSNHALSMQWMNRYTNAGGLLVAPALLLIEVSAAITRQSGQSILARQAVTYLQSVSQMRIVPIDSVLVDDACDIAADLSLRAGDAVYVAVARQMTIPLVSWDRQQLQRAATVLVGHSPHTFPF